jgi:MFS family permease
MVNTGKTPISVMTLLAILAISLVVNLPGLAITPMLGNLSKVFPHTTQIEEQLLTVLPNLLIIPFVLLSGKLSLSRHKIGIVVTGLLIFTGCSVWYLFANSMLQLIIISCLLGCGAGLLIPLASGLISDTFTGKYRVRMMGVKSGISNSSLVAATYLIGWLSGANWHVPFAVYLICLIPLVMTLWLREIPDSDLYPAVPSSASNKTDVAQPGHPDTHDGFYPGRLWSLIGVYFFITFATITISYYCPFLVEKKGWSTTLTGTVTALFFLFILIPGYSLPFFLRHLKGNTFFFCGVIMTIGMGLFAFVPVAWVMCVGASLAGLGYGICQPLIYDKASRAVTSESKATLSLAFVLAANYISIAVTPFIIDFFRNILHASKVTTFAFIVCFVLLVGYTVITLILKKKFIFNIDNTYY